MVNEVLDEENEVLQSIFPDEYLRLAAEKFQITQRFDQDESELKENYLLQLTAVCSGRYPDEIPELEIEVRPEGGQPILSDTNASDELNEFMSADLDRLASIAEQTANENIGMSMLFSIYSAVREEALNVCEWKKRRRQEVVDEQRRLQDEQENRKFRGTPVTVASFNEWKQRFMLERQQKENEREKARQEADTKAGGATKKSVKQQKMTGRQLFEANKALATSDQLLDYEQDNDLGSDEDTEVVNDSYDDSERQPEKLDELSVSEKA